MRTSGNAPAELNSNWLAFNLMSTLAEGSQASYRKRSELEDLVRLIAMRVGQQTGANHGVVALATDNCRTAVRWMSTLSGVGQVETFPAEQLAGLEFSAEDVGFSTRLRTPVIVASNVVGFLEFSMSGENRFHTPDKQLLHVVAGWLALLQQREVLTSCAAILHNDQEALLDYAITGTSWNCMFHEIWSITENPENNGTALCEMVLRLISSRIPNAVALLSFWDTDVFPLEVVSASDQRMLHQCRAVLEEYREEVCKRRKVRSILRSKRSSEVLGTVIICPLTRVPQCRGIIALARKQGEPQFTTVEVKALEITAALLAGWPAFAARTRSDSLTFS